MRDTMMIGIAVDGVGAFRPYRSTEVRARAWCSGGKLRAACSH